MEKPDSIIRVNTDVLVGISSYDAYVYEYLNVENGKKYVGSHLGEYGDGYCIGHMENIKEEIDLYNLCENTDSKGEKFWLEGIRKTGKERGVGTLTYVKTSEKYKQFLIMKCNYGVSWFNQDSFFLKQKCNLK